jgi:hypothetical protein
MKMPSFLQECFHANGDASSCVSLTLRKIILYSIFSATIRGNRIYLFSISRAWNKINPDIKRIVCSIEIKS